MPFESISISTNSNFLLLFLGMIFLFAYAFYTYKYTIPQISKKLRYFLFLLRGLVIVLLLLLVFEPIFSITKKDIIEPKLDVFIDNSNSIAIKDSTQRLNKSISFLKELIDIDENKFQIFTFGAKVKPLQSNQLNKIKLNESRTNFADIISEIKNHNENLCAAVILSDGIITDGSDPIYEAEKLQIPIITVGIGDTTQQKDVQIRDAVYNQYIYANIKTEIEAVITQYGFDNHSVTVSLYYDDRLVQSKNVKLNQSGLNKVRFDYIPMKSGERKMRVVLSQLPGEANASNNYKIFFVNVLENKIKVTVVAGSPSPDLSAISSSLEKDKNIELKKLIQISPNKFWKDANTTVIDSADILFFIDFPSSSTPKYLLDKALTTIQNKNKPFFVLVSTGTDLYRLRSFEKYLPFSVQNISDDFYQIQPEIVNNLLSFTFSKASNQKDFWNNLPPLTRNSSEFIPKPESNVLVRAKVRNIALNSPLFIIRSIANQRSIAILAGDIWRWQLFTAEKNPVFFQDLLNDIVKWLSASEKQKQFIVKTSKKVYSSGETVEFTAELYDQTFSPIDSAQIELTVSKGTQKYELVFNKFREGIFQTVLESAEPGDHSYQAVSQFQGTSLKSDVGKFSVGDIQIEKINSKMDASLLQQLANATGGNFYFVDDYSSIKERISKILAVATKDKLSVNDIDLRSNLWILIFIICLFAIEWSIRKRVGML